MAKRVDNCGSFIKSNSNAKNSKNGSIINKNNTAERNNNSGGGGSLVDLVKQYLYVFDDNDGVGGCGSSYSGSTAELASPVRFLLPSKKLGVGGTIVVALLKCFSLAYDLITWFGYYWCQKKSPRDRIAAHLEIKVSFLI